MVARNAQEAKLKHTKLFEEKFVQHVKTYEQQRGPKELCEPALPRRTTIVLYKDRNK